VETDAQDTSPPPGGWQLRGEEQPSPEAMADVLEKLVELLPADLQQRLVQAVHELLEAIRALIEWWLARLEQRTSGPVAVRDIPIL
jgi:predicted lipid carrier protein YhbT